MWHCFEFWISQTAGVVRQFWDWNHKSPTVFLLWKLWGLSRIQPFVYIMQWHPQKLFRWLRIFECGYKVIFKYIWVWVCNSLMRYKSKQTLKNTLETMDFTNIVRVITGVYLGVSSWSWVMGGCYLVSRFEIQQVDLQYSNNQIYWHEIFLFWKNYQVLTFLTHFKAVKMRFIGCQKVFIVYDLSWYCQAACLEMVDGVKVWIENILITNYQDFQS